MMFFLLLPALSAALVSVNCDIKIPFTPSTDIYPFALSRLPYDPEFLSPVLSSQLLYLHHDYHHLNYVEKLNAYVTTVEKYKDNLLVELVDLARDDSSLQKYAGGHYNHLLYWWIMTNQNCAPKEPSGKLLSMINLTWGNLTVLQEEFSEASLSLLGSGWTWLCVNEDQELEIRNTENEINPLMEVSGDLCYPILANNIWEHAYYLKFMWNRDSYINQFWKLIDWDTVTLFYDEYARNSEGVPLQQILEQIDYHRSESEMTKNVIFAITRTWVFVYLYILVELPFEQSQLYFKVSMHSHLPFNALVQQRCQFDLYLTDRFIQSFSFSRQATALHDRHLLLVSFPNDLHPQSKRHLSLLNPLINLYFGVLLNLINQSLILIITHPQVLLNQHRGLPINASIGVVLQTDQQISSFLELLFADPAALLPSPLENPPQPLKCNIYAVRVTHRSQPHQPLHDALPDHFPHLLRITVSASVAESPYDLLPDAGVIVMCHQGHPANKPGINNTLQLLLGPCTHIGNGPRGFFPNHTN